MHSRVERKIRRDGADAFGVVSRAIGSPDFAGSLEFGAIWAATPDLHRLPVDSWKDDWHVALDATDLASEYPTSGVAARLISWAGNPLLDFAQTIAAYPSLRGDNVKFISEPHHPPGAATIEPGSWSVVVEWKGEGVQIDHMMPNVGLRGGRRIIPPLPGHSEPLAPLMLVWLLAYSLSLFARYNPGPWAAAMAVDSSTRAVPIATIMDQMLAAIPLLVYDAVFKPDDAL